MKLNYPKNFSLTDILKTEAGKALESFLSYSNVVTDRVAQILRNNVNLTDNIDCKIVSIPMLHNTETSIGTAARLPVGIQILKVSSVSVGVDSFTWYVNASNNMIVKVGFVGSSTGVLYEVKFLIYY